MDGLIIKAIRETLSDECIRDEVIEQFINQSGNIVQKIKYNYDFGDINRALKYIG